MFPILQLGPLALQLPGLFLLLGVWLATWLLEREAIRLRLSPAAATNMAFYGLLAGLVGARLWYAGQFLSVYLQNPLSLLSLNFATLSPGGGLAIGLLVALWLGQRKRLPLWPTLDALAPGLAAFAVALGLAHLSSGDAFGAPTALPWGIRLWGETRHPSQVYEIIAAGLILLAVLRLQRMPAPDTFGNRGPVTPPPAGYTFLLWAALTAAARLLLEAFRGDSLLWPGGLRAAQVISLGLLLIALWGLRARYRLSRPAPPE
ncbi:MAG: prolipoprotein diacylglyceryl transferase [Chloroflexi bacterium]|nr:prolipoprotein diacylglyceryl transferase [Chloroflexota bacterium]